MDDNKAENIIFGLKETIAEQKAEIERLTKENAIIKGNPPMIVGRSNGKTIRAKLLAFDKMKERNDELQKQVDELKGMICELTADKCKLVIKEQQAVKDTAEKFAKLAKELLDKQEKGWSANMIWIITAKNCIDEICKRITEGN